MESFIKKSSFVWLLICLFSFGAYAQDYVLRSPNARAEVRIRVADKVYFSAPEITGR